MTFLYTNTVVVMPVGTEQKYKKKPEHYLSNPRELSQFL
jgi:hypothetical protein